MLPSQDSLLSSVPSSLEESSTEALQRRTIHGSAWIMNLPGDSNQGDHFNFEPSRDYPITALVEVAAKFYSTLSNFYYPWPTTNPGSSSGSGTGAADSGISVNGASTSVIPPAESTSRGGHGCSATVFKCANCDEEIEFDEKGAESEHRIYWCSECEGYIVDGCVVPHLIHKSTKWHTLSHVSPLSRDHNSPAHQEISKPQVCWTHKDLVTSYCEDCHVVCCSHCLLKHGSHSHKPIRDHHVELSHVFEGLLNIRLSRERQIQTRAEEMSLFANKCSVFKKEAEQKIREKYSELRNRLNDLENEALEELHSIGHNFDITLQSLLCVEEKSKSMRKEISEKHGLPSNAVINSFLRQNAELVAEETELLVACSFEEPHLVLTNEEARLKYFSDAVKNSSYKLYHPSMKLEFPLDIDSLAEDKPTKEPLPNQIAQTEHFQSRVAATVRDLAYDAVNQRIFIVFKNNRSIVQYSLQGELQATIKVHSAPWRLQIHENVLYFSVQTLEGIFAVDLVGETPSIQKLCHMKSCAFSVLDSSSILIGRLSKPELTLVDFKHGQIVNRVSHTLQQAHYIAHCPQNGQIAVSNACEAIVLLFSQSLNLLLKIDANSHDLKWPIGLCFDLFDNTDLESSCLYICDSDSHSVIAINSYGATLAKYDSLQGVSFARTVTRNMLVTASVLNLKIKFLQTEKYV